MKELLALSQYVEDAQKEVNLEIKEFENEIVNLEKKRDKAISSSKSAVSRYQDKIDIDNDMVQARKGLNEALDKREAIRDTLVTKVDTHKLSHILNGVTPDTSAYENEIQQLTDEYCEKVIKLRGNIQEHKDGSKPKVIAAIQMIESLGDERINYEIALNNPLNNGKFSADKFILDELRRLKKLLNDAGINHL